MVNHKTEKDLEKVKEKAMAKAMQKAKAKASKRVAVEKVNPERMMVQDVGTVGSLDTLPGSVSQSLVEKATGRGLTQTKKPKWCC